MTLHAAQKNKKKENMKGKLRDMEDRVRGSQMHWTGIPEGEKEQDG